MSTFQNDIAHARFSSKISADAAIAGLDKQEILGIKVSVFYAEAPLKDTEKRLAKSLWSIYYIFSFFYSFLNRFRSVTNQPVKEKVRLAGQRGLLRLDLLEVAWSYGVDLPGGGSFDSFGAKGVATEG